MTMGAAANLRRAQVLLLLDQRKDAALAKKYLEELELKRLELLVEQFLAFAELRSIEKTPTYMSDWLKKLDGFLVLNEKKILTHAGKVSHKEMEERVRKGLAAYNQGMKQKQIKGPDQKQ
jgi:hypothetical protein